MHVGPSTDYDGIDFWRLDQLGPVLIDSWDAEFGGGFFGRSAGSVANPSQFDTWKAPQPGNVTLGGIRSRPDDPNSDPIDGHGDS
jgi:hypothetical protein